MVSRALASVLVANALSRAMTFDDSGALTATDPARLFVEDTIALGDAFVADKNRGTRNEFIDLALLFAAEGTVVSISARFSRGSFLEPLYRSPQFGDSFLFVRHGTQS